MVWYWLKKFLRFVRYVSGVNCLVWIFGNKYVNVVDVILKFRMKEGFSMYLMKVMMDDFDWVIEILKDGCN